MGFWDNIKRLTTYPRTNFAEEVEDKATRIDIGKGSELPPGQLDQFGRPVEQQSEQPPQRFQLVKPRSLSPRVDSLTYNPTTIKSKLKQAESGSLGEQLQMFARMIEQDCHLQSVVQQLRADIQIAKQEFEAPVGLEDHPQMDEAIELCKIAASTTAGYEEAKGTLAEGAVFGFRGLEIEWNKSMPFALEDAPDDGWKWNKGLEVLTKDGWERVPQDKFVIHSPRGVSTNLLRRGAMRAVAFVWVLKHYATRDWGSFVEVFGMPPRIAKTPYGPDDPRNDDLYDLLDFGSDFIALVPEGVEVEIGNAMTSTTKSPHELFVEWCDRQMSKAILSQTLTSDTTGATGTFSTAKIHKDVKTAVTQAGANAAATSLRRDFFAPVVYYNLGPEAPVPVLKLTIVDWEAIKLLLEILDLAVNKVGLPLAAGDVYRLTGLPKPAKDAELVGGAPQPVNPFEPTQPELPPELMRAAIRRAEILRARTVGEVPLALGEIEAIADELWSANERDSVVTMVTAMAEQGISLEQMREQIVTRYPSLRGEGLSEVLAQAMSAAANNGVVEVGAEQDRADDDEGTVS